MYTESLYHSLIDRARAFGSYVSKLRALNGRSDSGFNLALQLFEEYADAVVRQAEFDWRTTASNARHDNLLGLVREFFEKEKWFDAHFARSTQHDIPHALQTLVRREFRVHGWNDYEPVLTVGAPDNFETHRSDLAQYLFGRNLPNGRGRDRSPLPLLSVISVPYIEGTSALWHPIVIGHEVGHIRVEADKVRGSGLDPRGWISDLEIGRVAEEQRVTGVQALARFAQDTRHSLGSWVEEIICDLNTVRLFGPAGLSSISEFLSLLIGSDGVGAEAPTASHPPLSLRITLMLDFLTQLGMTSHVSFLDPWKDYAENHAMGLAPRSQLVASAVRSNLSAILNHVVRWGPSYSSHTRSVQLAWARDELLDGIPVGTHCLADEAIGAEMVVPDVVASAWMARYRLESKPADSVSGVQPALFTSNLTVHQRRLQVDMLAQKAINSLEFVALWATTGGLAVNVADTDAPPDGEEARLSRGQSATPGLLSKKAIIRRLRNGPGDRLVVTPLLEGAIGDAGIDLRLAPQFIVFRHSGTTAFDALDETQDPRVMQDAVENSWGEQFILHPGELVLAATLEYVVLPSDLAGQVVTRSSYGRLGLITATAVQVQPGSRGSITLELVNHGTTPIALTAGSRIAQLVLFGIAESEEEPRRPKYMFPTGPEFSRVAGDDDLEALRAIGRTARPALSYSKVEEAARAHEPTIAFEFSGTNESAVLFQTIAESEGASSAVTLVADLPSRQSDGNADAGVVGGEAIIAYLVGGATALGTLAAMAVRFARAIQHPTIVRIKDGKATIEVDRTLPRSGRTYTVSDDSLRLEISEVAPTAVADVTRHLGEILTDRVHRRRQALDAPPADDSPN